MLRLFEKIRTYLPASVLLVVLILNTFITNAQLPKPAFTNYSMSEGLPSSEVYHAMQDSKGYIWFATSMGVSRYNGYEFLNFSLQDGLPDLTVFNIYEDYKGRIWFTSFSGKLSYYYQDSVYQYKYNDRLQEKFKMHYKSSIYVDEEDNIYLSVFCAGYFVVNKKGEIKQYKDNRPGYY